MSANGETSYFPSAEEVCRTAIKTTLSYEAGSTISVENHAEPSLPSQIFLGGQLEIENGDFIEISIINSNTAQGRVINLDYAGDRYMITDTKIFNVEDPLKDLGETELESLGGLFKNPNIIWSRGQTNRVIRLARKDRVATLASNIVVEEITL